MNGQNPNGTVGFHVAFADIDDDGTDEVLLGKPGGSLTPGSWDGTGIPGALRIWTRFQLQLSYQPTYYTWSYYYWGW